MSRKGVAPDVELRSGVLSWFTYKKKTLLHREAYELSPLYWKCMKMGNGGAVILSGYRSEQSRGGKPRINLVVNGCTIELLPPMLRSLGADHPGNDNYMCIQTDDDKIVFLKAEGRAQRDDWFQSISEGLGLPTKPLSTSGAMSMSNNRSPSRLPLSKPHMDNNSKMAMKGDINEENALYHLPYNQGVENNTRGSKSTDEDTASWKNSPLPLQRQQPYSDIENDDHTVKLENLCDDGDYVLPTSKPPQIVTRQRDEECPKEEKEKEENMTPPRYSSPKRNPPGELAALQSQLIGSLNQTKDKPRTADDATSMESSASRSPMKEASIRPSSASKQDPSLSPRPVVPVPMIKKNNKPVLPDPPPKGGKEILKPSLPETVPGAGSSPGTRRDSKPSHEPSEVVIKPQPHIRKPLKAPPPKPAGGNSKPKPLLIAMDKPETLPQPPISMLAKSKSELPPTPPSASTKPTTPVSESSDNVDHLRDFVKSVNRDRMSQVCTDVTVAMTTVSEDTLSIINIDSALYIRSFTGELGNSDLLIGDEIRRINDQPVSTVEAAYKSIGSAVGNSLTFSLKRIPHGELTFISRPQESTTIDTKDLGLTLQGTEVIQMDPEGLVVRSGTPSQPQIAGVVMSSSGKLVNWALTQINSLPIRTASTTADVEQILSDTGGHLLLVFHPVDFASALAP